MNVLAPKQLEGTLMKSQDTRRKAAKAAERLADAADHVDRALAQWSREMPDVTSFTLASATSGTLRV